MVLPGSSTCAGEKMAVVAIQVPPDDERLATVLFIPTFKLVQTRLTTKKALKLAAWLKKLDRCAVVALDDIGYVQQDREEVGGVFTFLAERCERGRVMIASNLVFSK